ncbi:hypothetical protein V3C99_001799 [Haemonchus contortus]
MTRRFDWWIRQAYLAIIPSYPIGYLVVHGFRGDQIWSKLYVERSVFPPSEYLKELVESEMDKLEKIKNPKVRLSLTDSSEPRVYGGFFLQTGAELQFPMRMSLDDVEQARRLASNIELDLGLASPAFLKRNALKGFWEGNASHRRKIEVNTKIGEELTSRMMLSDAAKMFLVQRQLQLANSFALFNAPYLTWFGIFGAGYGISVGLSSFVGVAVGTLVGVVFSAVAFRQFFKSYTAYKVRWADEKTVEIGEEYLQGACDYFRSTMKFNRLLRVLLGEEGEQNITRSGDVRMDPIPLSVRLKNVSRLWKSKTAASKEEASLS